MVRYRWEMGLTREEFLRCLPLAVGGDPYEDDGRAIAGSGWRLTAAERPARRIALISMPVLEVALEVDADGDTAAAFVRRFLLGYQRAGG